jgi:hypothetical protein
MENLKELENRTDEFTRLEHAIASNKRYLLELNRTLDSKNYDEVYCNLIRVQERLLKEISKIVL